MRALVDRDTAARHKVIRGDDAIDQLHRDRRSLLKLLALHQPMAVDLRVIVAAVDQQRDLERVADLAVNIAGRPSAVAIRRSNR